MPLLCLFRRYHSQSARRAVMSHLHTHALEGLLTLTHSSCDVSQSSTVSTVGLSASCPLTLVEDTLTCAADFLLLQAVQTFLERNKTADNTQRQPAVVLCTFKQPAQHYSHIARKWVSSGRRASV